MAGQAQATIQIFQRGKVRGGPVNFVREFFAVGLIARVLQRHQKRRQLPLRVRIQRRQFLFQDFNAHGLILMPGFVEATGYFAGSAGVSPACG